MATIRQSIETMLYSYIMGAASVEQDLGVKCEVRYVTIPDAHPEPEGKQFFDPKVMDSLIGLVSEQKKSLIVVTHDTNLARLGDRTLELADGRLVH